MRPGRKPISRLQAIKYCSTAAERRTRTRTRIGEELQRTHQDNKKRILPSEERLWSSTLMGGETNVLLQVAHMSVSETNYRDALARGADEQNKHKTKLRIQLIKVLIMLIPSANYGHQSADYANPSAKYADQRANYADSSANYAHQSADYANPRASYAHQSADYANPRASYAHQSADYANPSAIMLTKVLIILIQCANYANSSANNAHQSADYANPRASYAH
jgi:hypothetical protein